MKINVLYVGLVVIVLYFLFFNRKKEGFQTNQRVFLKTSDDKYGKICSDKHFCMTDNKDEAEQFSIMKFSDDLIALSKGGYYLASCFGEACQDDMIKANSFNPYAPNAKLALEKDGDYYYIKFYDDKYMSVDENNNVIKHIDKAKAIRVQFS